MGGGEGGAITHPPNCCPAQKAHLPGGGRGWEGEGGRGGVIGEQMHWPDWPKVSIFRPRRNLTARKDNALLIVLFVMTDFFTAYLGNWNCMQCFPSYGVNLYYFLSNSAGRRQEIGIIWKKSLLFSLFLYPRSKLFNGGPVSQLLECYSSFSYSIHVTLMKTA